MNTLVECDSALVGSGFDGGYEDLLVDGSPQPGGYLILGDFVAWEEADAANGLYRIYRANNGTFGIADIVTVRCQQVLP